MAAMIPDAPCPSGVLQVRDIVITRGGARRGAAAMAEVELAMATIADEFI